MRKLSRTAKKKLIQATGDVVRRILKLDDWVLSYNFKNKRTDLPESEQCQASCEASPEYRTATLTFVLDEIDANEIHPLVVHEMLHCVMWPMAHFMDRWAAGDDEKTEMARYAQEAVNTHLDRIVVALVPPLEQVMNDTPKVRKRAKPEPVQSAHPQEGTEAKEEGP